jgi:hypothetical protein
VLMDYAYFGVAHPTPDLLLSDCYFIHRRLTPRTVPAATNAEMVNSDLTSKDQISSLPQTDDRLADGIEYKSGEDVSHGRVSSSAEGMPL